MDRQPHLSFSGDDARAEAVVLLLHGGTTNSFETARAFDPAVLRMIPFGRSVVRAGGGRIALATVRFAVRGWNGASESPLPDARWALDQIAERFGDLPIGLVGHSMGGRVALRVANHVDVLEGAHGVDHGTDHGGDHRPVDHRPVDHRPVDHRPVDHRPVDHRPVDHRQGVQSRGVRSVAALAPWLPGDESLPPLGDRSLLLAHGTADRITDPRSTATLAKRLAADGHDVEMVTFPGARHSMLFPAKPWHDLVAKFMVRTLLSARPPGPA